MFNMDLKSNGIAWVDNIYQKIEAMCQEVEDEIRIQEKAKYIESQVQTGCDNVRKFCAEVMQDLLLPAACDVKGPVSDLSLIYDVDVGIWRKSKVGSPIEEKMLTPAELDVFVSSGKGSSPAPLPDVQYAVNEGEACGALTNKSVPILEEVTGCDCLEKAGENHSNHSDACFAVPSAVPSASVLSTEVIAVAGTCVSHEPMSLPSAVSLENEHEQHSKSVILDFVLPSLEIERSNDFDWEEASMSTDAIEPSIETIEEFEDVKFEENCMDPEAEKNEICFISLQDQKKRSYKKKLRDVFASKMRSAKKQDIKQPENYSRNGPVKIKHYEEISMSSMHTEDSTKKLLAHDTCESEWELL